MSLDLSLMKESIDRLLNIANSFSFFFDALDFGEVFEQVKIVRDYFADYHTKIMPLPKGNYLLEIRGKS